MRTSTPAGEPDRVSILRQYRILHTPPEQAFDDIARLAATICGASASVIAFDDGSRPWCKSIFGFTVAEFARISASLSAVDEGRGVFVSELPLQDRAAGIDVAKRKNRLRFLAGVPIVAPGGGVLGMLSVLNAEPLDLTLEQSESLERLSRQIVELLELRKNVWNLEAAVTKRKKVAKVLEARNRDLTAQKFELEAQKHLLEVNSEDMAQGNALYEYASQRFLELFQGLPVACFCYDSQGRIFEWNRAFEVLYGLSAEDTLLKTVWDAVCRPEDADTAKEHVRRVFEGEAIEGIERTDLRADGSRCIVLCNTFPIRHPDGIIVGGISANIDITERRQAEEALRQSEERYRQIFHNNGAIKLLIEVADGRIVDANPAACAYYGCGIETLRGMRIAEINIQTAEQTREGLRLAESAQMSPIHQQHRLANGVIRDVAIHAGPVDVQGKRYVYAIVQDITEQVRAEEALRESELRFRSVTESASDAIITVDNDDRIIFWNKGAEAMFGYEDSAILGQTLGWILPNLYDHPHRRVQDAARSYDKTGLIGKTLELTAACKDGTSMPVEVSLATWSTTHGVFCSGIIRDITERKRYEQQLRTQMEQINSYSADLEFHKQRLETINKKLEALAKLDGMTGLKNHRAFQERLLSEFQRSMRYSTPLSLLLLDVDGFKNYNDSYGHPAGDEVLKQVAQILQDNARGVDFVARYGGEEFVVILPHTDSSGAIALADRFRIAIEKSEWPNCPVTASFGVSTLTPALSTPQDMVADADKALYISKARGRNRVTHCIDVSPAVLEACGTR